MPYGDRSTPEYVGSTAATGTATTASVTRPANATIGDLLMIGVTLFDSSIVTVTSTGWSQIVGQGNTTPGEGHSFCVLWRIDDGTAGPYTVAWNGTSQFYNVFAVAYRGEAGVDTQTVAATSVVSTTFRGPSVTTAAPNESVVMIGTLANTGASLVATPPSGFVVRVNLSPPGTGRGVVMDTVIAPNGATGNRDATLGATDASTVAMVALTSGPRPTPIPPESGSRSPGLAGPGAEEMQVIG